MSKAIVNMTPNPSDIQTIHCSQGDTDAREWEFELHNNGEVIDAGGITEQMVFKSYKGGTEQILPENGTVPVTAPFVGDIQYPDATRNDQEFLYRQSPTEEDGLAKITDIKGNTLVWNQLVENGDFSASSGWTGQFATVTISNGVASVSQDRVGDYVALRKSNLQGLTGHKYLVVADVKSAKKTAIAFYLSNAFSSAYDIQANTRTVVHAIITVSNANNGGFNVYTNRKVELAEGDVVEIYHVMLFDLTQMGLDITDPSEFTSLFPKPYYDYCKGAMLSFGGRNVKFNQLLENGNFADTSKWSAESGATLSISNNIATISSATVNNGIRQYFSNPLTVNHKYLIKAEFNVPTEYRCVIGTAANQGVQIDKLISTANTWTEVSGIGTCTVATTSFYCFVRGTTYENVKIRNVMCFDLTEMFGSGNEPSVEGFLELFKSGYYAYTTEQYMNIGQSVSLKTVGFNQWDEEWEVGAYQYLNGGKADGVRDRIRNKNPIRIFPSTNYYASKGLQFYYYDANMNFLSWNNFPNPTIITTPSGAYYMNFNGLANSGATYNNDICINISDTERNGTYEPYTSSTLSLPISTYFPSGMKSAGNVYDELTESKAITRIGAVDLGTLTWTYEADASWGNTFRASANYIKFQGQLLCPRYQGYVGALNNMPDMNISATNSQAYLFLRVKDSNYTDATAFKQAMTDQNVKLYYELATPTEISFTTASLVTENAEIPLSNEDGVLIGKCTEQLSENPGFIDAKIKLSDIDGECYSNKIQLHVERMPE